jgi:outer membrane protein assembly factor BamB
LLWKLQGLGTGYSTVSIANGAIITMGDRSGTDGAEAQFVIAFDRATRTELWATRVGPPHKDGPRSTPTIDGDLVYALGTEGDLLCLETKTGAVRWQKNLPRDFGGQMMSRWKFAESILVDGGRVICTPGARDAALVALDAKSGDVVWKCAVPDLGPQGKDGAGYASAMVTTIDGVRQYVQLLGRGAVGVEAATGRFLWGYNRIANGTANIPSPVVRGRYVFVTTNYRTGSALLRINRAGDTFEAEEIFFLRSRQFENHHGGVVLVDGYVYGGHGANKGIPVCINLATGSIAWKAKAPARGSACVLSADGHIIFRYDRGLVALVEATPEKFVLKGSFEPPTGSGPAWAHPVVHDRKLYLRHDDLLLCYDLGG